MDRAVEQGLLMNEAKRDDDLEAGRLAGDGAAARARRKKKMKKGRSSRRVSLPLEAIENGHLNASHPLYRLPHAIRGNITSFLDTQSLCHASESCFGLYTDTNSNDVWTQRMRSDFRDKPEVLQFALRKLADANNEAREEDDDDKKNKKRRKGPMGAKACYMAGLEHEREQQREAERVRIRLEREAARQEFYRKITKGFHVCNESVFVCVFSPLVLLFTIFAVRAMDGNRFMTLAETSPLLCIVGCFLCSITSMCYVKWVDNPVPFDEHAYEDNNGIVKVVMGEMLRNQRRPLSYFCFGFTCFGATLVMIALQVSNTIDISYLYIFAPVLAVFAASCCIPYWVNGRMHGNERYKMCTAVWVVSLAPTLVFVLLLLIRVEVSNIHLAVVFIPCWLFNLISLLGAMYVSMDDGKPWPCLLWIVVVGPMLCFEVMYVVWQEDGKLNVTDVFIPFFLWLAFWIIGGCVLSGVIYKDSERRRRNNGR